MPPRRGSRDRRWRTRSSRDAARCRTIPAPSRRPG
jgi:hypothetical protein